MPLANSCSRSSLVVLAAGEQPRDREELAVGDGDEIVRPDERIELGGVQPLDRLVVDREVEDGEQVAVVLVVVDLRPLALGDDVLDVEGMPAEALGQHIGRLQVGPDDIDPGEAASAELANR